MRLVVLFSLLNVVLATFGMVTNVDFRKSLDQMLLL